MTDTDENNVTSLHKDPVPDMTGPRRTGNDVIIDGHVIPNIVMHDKGDMVEFILDSRLSYTFPREWAYLAASFAASAMAIGAGHPNYSVPHKSIKSYATPCVQLDEVPK